MISGQITDIIIYIYLGYSALIGVNRGIFNILIGVFGIYGASFFTWIFKDHAKQIAVDTLGFSSQMNVSLFFMIFWATLYGAIFVIGKLLTGMFKLTGMSILIRALGGIFNTAKAALIVTVAITFLTKINPALLSPTKTCLFFSNIGYRVIDKYQAKKAGSISLPSSNISTDAVIMDDDFRYNLLER
jgi:uncharacterized membrane protein required for colicin V production